MPFDAYTYITAYKLNDCEKKKSYIYGVNKLVAFTAMSRLPIMIGPFFFSGLAVTGTDSKCAQLKSRNNTSFDVNQ